MSVGHHLGEVHVLPLGNPGTDDHQESDAELRIAAELGNAPDQLPRVHRRLDLLPVHAGRPCHVLESEREGVDHAQVPERNSQCVVEGDSVGDQLAARHVDQRCGLRDCDRRVERRIESDVVVVDLAVSRLNVIQREMEVVRRTCPRRSTEAVGARAEACASQYVGVPGTASAGLPGQAGTENDAVLLLEVGGTSFESPAMYPEAGGVTWTR